jgi:hypothetical protein
MSALLLPTLGGTPSTDQYPLLVMSRYPLVRGFCPKSCGMTKAMNYKRHRFPPQIIAHSVLLYFRFPLSLRLVEEMLLERGIVVSYETIRRWGKKFGPAYARLRRRSCRSSSG